MREQTLGAKFEELERQRMMKLWLVQIHFKTIIEKIKRNVDAHLKQTILNNIKKSIVRKMVISAS